MRAELIINPAKKSMNFHYCIRISCGDTWDQKVKEGVTRLGRLIKDKS